MICRSRTGVKSYLVLQDKFKTFQSMLIHFVAYSVYKMLIFLFKGMASTSCDRKTSLEEYGVNLDVVYARTGAFGRIGKSTNPNLWEQFDAEAIYNQLRCTHDESHWLVRSLCTC